MPTSLPPRRVQWWVSLVEQPLPAGSLNRNNRNKQQILHETPDFFSLRVRSTEKSPECGSGWFSFSALLLFLLFRVVVCLFWSDLILGKIFCSLFSDRTQKPRNNPDEKRHTNIKKFEILVFICANPRQNRPAQPVKKNPGVWSWALLLSSPLTTGRGWPTKSSGYA